MSNLIFGGADNQSSPKGQMGRAKLPKSLRVLLGSTSKTIKAPGLSNARTAQACDRCRAKKLRCDGKFPACSLCAAAGLKCIVSDKLSRRAFPKGYTETLEERVRQLEAENTKLQGLVDLRDEQLAMTGASGAHASQNNNIDRKLSISTFGGPNLGTGKISPANDGLLSTHNHDESCNCCAAPHAVHERPVSLAGSLYHDGSMRLSLSVMSDEDFDTNSLLSLEDTQSLVESQIFSQSYGLQPIKECGPAPGAFAAATAIEQMQRKDQTEDTLKEENKQRLLTGLVTASIPRSTEETLFIPTLLARICQLYGYNSKPAITTAHSLAALKENINLSPSPDDIDAITKHEDILKIIMDKDSPVLSKNEGLKFIRLLDFPARAELDQLLTIFFLTWGSILPVLNKQMFLKNYLKLLEILESVHSDDTQLVLDCELFEKFGAIMVLVVSLGTFSNRYADMNSSKMKLSQSRQRLGRYHQLIHEFIKANCIITKYGSMQSLQILTLALQYCFAVGDINTCYELRGRVITMAQQMRLHRCPAAVLGLSNSVANISLQHAMQGERRILFWCIYCLDVYSSLNLGIPRLLKDYEIECAMPFSGKNDDDDDEKNNENILIINNTSLTIFGKVSKESLAFMQYCKVLGNIMDSIFCRSEDVEVLSKSMEKERILDCWRRDLPPELKFEIDVNGLSLQVDSGKQAADFEEVSWDTYSKAQINLIFLYYHAKILIYLPIISKYGYHHNAGMSMKEKLSMRETDVATVVSSMTMIQQSSIQILKLLNHTASKSAYVLPIPINIPRARARFSLLVAKGSLDYIKGGPLHHHLKQLLLETLLSFQLETENELSGGLTKNTLKLLDFSILSILGVNMKKISQSGDLRKKVAFKASGFKKLAQDIALSRSFDSSRMPMVHHQVIKDLDELASSQQSLQYGSQRQFPSPETLSSDTGERGKSESVGPQLCSSSDMISEERLFELFPLEHLDDGFDDMLKFDPFKMHSNEMIMSDFVADGSLGLVPFLNDREVYKEDDDDRLSDKMDEDGAFLLQ